MLDDGVERTRVRRSPAACSRSISSTRMTRRPSSVVAPAGADRVRQTRVPIGTQRAHAHAVRSDNSVDPGAATTRVNTAERPTRCAWSMERSTIPANHRRTKAKTRRLRLCWGHVILSRSRRGRDGLGKVHRRSDDFLMTEHHRPGYAGVIAIYRPLSPLPPGVIPIPHVVLQTVQAQSHPPYHITPTQVTIRPANPGIFVFNTPHCFILFLSLNHNAPCRYEQ